MSIATKFLKQKAVYWPPQERDEFGQKSLGDPVELDCRWDDEQEEQVDAEGNKFISRAQVMVDRDLSKGGLLLLATIEDVNTEDFPDNPKQAGAVEVRTMKRHPTIDAKDTVRIAIL